MNVCHNPIATWGFSKLSMRDNLNILDIGCGGSFGIYLIHILFLDGYKKYAEPAAVSAWIAVPVLIAGIGGLSFLCITLLRRSRIGRAIT